MCACVVTYVGGDKICDHVESDPPPDGAEDVAGEVLHPPQKADGMVDLGEVLEQKHY